MIINGLILARDEVAYYIWLTDNHINFQYHPDVKFEYDGKIHYYFPDFLVNGEVHEIKGDMFFKNKDKNDIMICPFNDNTNALCEAKHKCMIENNVKILTSVEMKPYLDYINEKYGCKYLMQFKVK